MGQRDHTAAYRRFRLRGQSLLRDNKLLIITELVVALLIIAAYLAGFIPSSETPFLFLTILLTSILVVVSSVLIYGASIFKAEPSTSALVFIFIPIYALITIAVVYGIAWLLLKSFMPKSKA